jgi:hypothetical protein
VLSPVGMAYALIGRFVSAGLGLPRHLFYSVVVHLFLCSLLVADIRGLLSPPFLFDYTPIGRFVSLGRDLSSPYVLRRNMT